MLKEYLTYLHESIPTKFRKKVEVFIKYQENKLIVGINDRWGKPMLMLPGGGIEKGESLEKTAEKECLEELGIKIKNPKLMSKKTMKVDWYEAKKRGVNLPQKSQDRMLIYRGTEIYFMKAEFEKVDMRYYGKDKDQMKPKIVTIDQMKKDFKQRSSTGDYVFRKMALFRVNLLDQL